MSEITRECVCEDTSGVRVYEVVSVGPDDRCRSLPTELLCSVLMVKTSKVISVRIPLLKIKWGWMLQDQNHFL